MSNRNRSNKRQNRAPVWFNDHVVGTSSQNHKEKADMSTGKENSVQNYEINVAVQNTVTGKKGGDKKNGVKNTVNEVEVNTNGSDPKEVMNVEINSSDEFPKELLYIPTEINEARNEVVVFDEMLVKNGSERWMLTTYGQFIGFNMHISELSKNGQYLFKFRDIDGLNNVIDKGPWMVQNKPLFIHKWNPEMGMQIIEPKQLPVWVKMSNVPLEAWSLKGEDIMLRTASPRVIPDRDDPYEVIRHTVTASSSVSPVSLTSLSSSSDHSSHTRQLTLHQALARTHTPRLAARMSVRRPRSPTPLSPSSRDSPAPQKHHRHDTYSESEEDEELDPEEDVEPQEELEPQEAEAKDEEEAEEAEEAEIEAIQEVQPDQDPAPLVHSPGIGSPWHMPDSPELPPVPDTPSEISSEPDEYGEMGLIWEQISALSNRVSRLADRIRDMTLERFEEMEREMGVWIGRTTSLRRELTEWH
ncbi:hypothetical protein CTI12_AA118250 [Artemisia annua]|uniref:DUF4283 domain-containing protein n=1 Tax=Artemisia annua TaxID=35608 RepID=A0A2U1PSM1_ARTAN|nr:hypothetical protein CTI12_AA118250 [Artemisia annua]